MTDIVKEPIFGLMVTLVFYLCAKRLQQKTKQRWLQPMLVSSLLLIGLVWQQQRRHE